MSTVQDHRTRIRDFLPIVHLSTLIESIGIGLFLTASTLYFVQIMGLSKTQVGAGLSLAGVVAMACSPVVARASSYLGPRRVLALLNVLRAAATVGYLWVDDWYGFAAATMIASLADQCTPSLIQTYVGTLAVGDLRSRVMAAQRTFLNAGISVGGLIAGAALGHTDRSTFDGLLLGAAATYVVVAVVLAWGDDGTAVRTRSESFQAPLRDRKFLAVTGYSALLSLWNPLLNVAFPLWLITGAHLPASYIGLLYAGNTFLCVFLQYPCSRYARTLRQARYSYTVSAWSIAGASACFLCSGLTADGAALLCVTAAVVLLTFAELFQLGADWTLTYYLSPEDGRNSYLLFFGVGRIMGARVAGPMIMTGVVLAWGSLGWVTLVALFVLAGFIPHFTRDQHFRSPSLVD
ncbi:hypothetical protein KEM60_02276 [Austwickia sp. TVS 96-490-7B]|uniref:MFS transporter n=1 Tax=Austwickia sp. TVS 96-490-7B TaxID=2830843 RepID=UPI001C5817AD|nr:MFS transporter [Austwickia sp. TVS 96-490-7B]MBW3086065.1 hypothetical protein [Austwickia sp. TVS 96-490-7B]